MVLTVNKVLRRDPTRTTLLRRQFIGQMNRRFIMLYKVIKKWLVEDDMLGLKPREKLKLLQERQYEFLTNPQKLDTFKKWLQEQINANILTTDGPAGAPWTGKYVESAYRKGLVRAYADTNAEILARSPEWYAGSQAQFLQTAFAQPEVMSKIELVSTRAFEQLRGVTATVAQQLNRHLATGLANGWGPLKIAREMQKSIGSLNRTRVKMIARTETIYAHAEGQLDAFELLGVDEIGVMAEWSTAGDDLVCPHCADMEGQTYKPEKAHGLIPLHPNCRCTWVPSTAGGKREVRGRPGAGLGRPLPASRPKAKPTVDLFAAKNIGKAESNMRRILGIDRFNVKQRARVSLEGLDVEVINKVNRALYNFKQVFPDIKLGSVSTYSGDVTTYMTTKSGGPVGPELLLNKAVLGKLSEIEGMVRKCSRTKWLVADTVEDLIYHELGHAACYNHIAAKLGRGMISSEMSRLSGVKFLEKGLSKYGATNGAEGLAETLTKYIKTGSIENVLTSSGRPESVVRIIKTYTGYEL